MTGMRNYIAICLNIVKTAGTVSLIPVDKITFREHVTPFDFCPPILIKNGQIAFNLN
jgi:hypothetical protein